MRRVYFIGGLGADKRIFSFLDLSFCDAVFIEWIAPGRNETLQEYALRLRQQIRDTNPVVVGISMGGMLVTEMAKADENIKGIIISSNKSGSEFPAYLRIGKYIPLYQWLPAGLLKKVLVFNHWILGARDPSHRKLLMRIIAESDIRFSRWAIRAILNWRNKEVPASLIHIHGSADRLLPCRLVKANYIINGGTHVMIMDKHREISDLLKNLVC